MNTLRENLPACWQDLYDAMNAGIDRVVLYGPPGTGKTYAGLHIGNVQAGAHRLICTEDMTQAEVTGCWMPNAQGTWNWSLGSAMKAWEGDGLSGGRLVVDEIDRAAGDVLSLLLAVTDTEASAEWQHPENGRVLRPRHGYSVIMTTNVEDMRELPEALRDRFPVRIRINTPHPDALLCLPSDLRAAAAASADADKDRRFSIRTFQAFARLRESMEMKRAASMVFGRHADAIVDAILVNGVAS